MKIKHFVILLLSIFGMVCMISTASAQIKYHTTTTSFNDKITNELGFKFVRAKKHSDGDMEVQYAGNGIGCTIYINSSGEIILSTMGCMDNKVQAAGGGSLQSERTLEWGRMTYVAVNGGSTAGLQMFAQKFTNLIKNRKSGKYTENNVHTVVDFYPDGSGAATIKRSDVNIR